MELRKILLLLFVGLLALSGMFAFQNPWREYPGREYENFPVPPDWQEKTEWAFARLMYPPMDGVHGRGGWGRRRGGSDWRSEEHTSELQSPCNLECRLLFEKKKKKMADGVVIGTLMETSPEIRKGRHCIAGTGFFFFNDTATTEIYTLSLHDALPIFFVRHKDENFIFARSVDMAQSVWADSGGSQCISHNHSPKPRVIRSEEHTSE